MEILYLSHCTPDAPDKGEKIRAFHLANHLATKHRVHVVCFARTPAEAEATRRLSGRYASVYVEHLSRSTCLARAGIGFARGASLAGSFFSSRRMRTYISSIVARTRLDVTLAYTTVMAPYAPARVPLLLDMSDVDSEKWMQYAQIRRPGYLYSTEGCRLRRMETESARRADTTVLMTVQEARLLSSFVGGGRILAIENGVDLARFDPASTPPLSHLAGRRFLVFVGFMDYFPNSDAARWFVTEVWPGLRLRDPDLELFIVGRNPSRSVRGLGLVEGVSVVDNPGDVKFYLATAVAAIAPLRLARGIQNKVLEALAMGKPIFASTEICATLGELPPGVIHCASPRDYIESITASDLVPGKWSATIREGAQRRFAWSRCLDDMLQELEDVVHRQRRSTLAFTGSELWR